MVGGIMLAANTGMPVEAVLALVPALIALSLLLLRTRASIPLVFAVVAATAACRFLVADPALSPASLEHRRPDLPRQGAELVGKVSDEPVYRLYRSGKGGMWTFTLRCEGMGESGQWSRLRGEVDVRVLGADPQPLVRRGQRLRIRGELQERNFRCGNAVGLKVSSERDVAALEDAPWFSPADWIRGWRKSAARRLETGIDRMPMQQAVLKALVLGSREEIPPETMAGFRRTGALHVFAISGLHVGIIGLLLAVALKSLGVPRDWFGVWLLPLLFLYVASTGMKSSALRALVMAGVFLLAPLFRRKPDIPTSVSFAAILLLLVDPQALLSAGFVFSFIVVTFIVMVFSAIPDAPGEKGWIRGYGISLAITSFAASLASIPLAAFYFGMFSPIALLGNLAVVPLTFCIVLSGWLSLLFPPASAIFNHAAAAFIGLMVKCVSFLDGIPGSSLRIGRPPFPAVLLWYGSLIYLFTHASRRRQRGYALAGAGCAILWSFLA